MYCILCSAYLFKDIGGTCRTYWAGIRLIEREWLNGITNRVYGASHVEFLNFVVGACNVLIPEMFRNKGQRSFLGVVGHIGESYPISNLLTRPTTKAMTKKAPRQMIRSVHSKK